ARPRSGRMVSWLEPTLLDFVEERLVADFQSPRGFHAVPPDFFQDLLDDSVLGFPGRPPRDLLEPETVPDHGRALRRRDRALIRQRLSRRHGRRSVRAPGEPRVAVGRRVQRSRGLAPGQLVCDELLALEDDDALDEVLELAHVAGPGVSQEALEELAGE